MAKPKYEEYVLPRLDEIKDWARNGATDEEIWKRLGIGRQSFYTYKNTHAEFSEVLKFNKDYCDAQIENALFEAAKAGNITAQIFWLKNRRAKRWREKVEETTQDDSAAVFIVDDINKELGGEYEPNDEETDT